MKNNAKLFLKSNYIESTYLNKILNKNSFDNGYIDIFVTNNGYNNTFNGRINLNNTTVKDLQIVDNLLLFVNSTPAIVNPFLAIPTLFRLTQNQFRLDGYHIEDGILKFSYDNNYDILDIFEIKTNGNLNDFRGNLKLDFPNNKVNGDIDTIFLKDYATVVNNIPLINKLFSNNTNGEVDFFVPVQIYGSIDDMSYRIKNTNENNDSSDKNSSIDKFFNVK